MLLADYAISNWKAALMMLKFVRVFCPTCSKSWEAVEGAAVKCGDCGGDVIGKQPTPDEPEHIQEMRLDRCDTSSLER